MAIPKRIYLFWKGSMPYVVRFCIDRIQTIHGGEWSVTVLDGESWVEPVENLEVLSVQHKSDWARMCAMQNGGVWLDASCICTASVDHWIDMHADAVQGFSTPFADDALENWAFAAPSESRLMVRWKDIFREAIVLGFGSFKKRVPQYIREHAIFKHMPYLTMHACYLMAAHETGERALLSPSCEGPFRYLCEKGFRTADAVKALMHHPLPNAPPLIKLRGAETKMIGTIECREGSFMHSLGANAFPRRQRMRVAISTIVTFVVIISVLALMVILRKL